MNERIRELADQCREEYPDTEWPDATYYRFDEAKFAELIVRECADLYENESDNWFGTDTKFVLKLYSKKLKEHFGVEE